jgi:hypothetical protein
MKNLPTSLLRLITLVVVSSALAVHAHAAANPKAGDRPNPKSSETHPGEHRSAEGKAKADANKGRTPEKSALDRYDVNGNGKMDPDEIAAMQSDKKKGETSKSKKPRS